MGRRQEFEKMIDESSGNGGRSAGSADSAAVLVLWFYSLSQLWSLHCAKRFSSSATRRFFARVRVQKISLDFDLASLSAMLNVSVSAADVRVENPDFYDFKYIDSRMAILYHGEQLGVGELGAGTIRSRNTVTLPSAITVEVIRLLLNAQQDIASNVATFSINSVLSGHVDLAHIFKKHVCVLLNWAMNVFLSNQTLKQNDCKQTMKL